MSNEAMRAFVGQVMEINATMPGMGSASSGILGMGTSGDKTVYQLKKTVLEFAAEHDKSNPDKALLEDLAGKIEGFIQTLQIFSVVSEERYDQLMKNLQALTQS
jgi:predicted amidohydrolase